MQVLPVMLCSGLDIMNGIVTCLVMNDYQNCEDRDGWSHCSQWACTGHFFAMSYACTGHILELSKPYHSDVTVTEICPTKSHNQPFHLAVESTSARFFSLWTDPINALVDAIACKSECYGLYDCQCCFTRILFLPLF